MLYIIYVHIYIGEISAGSRYLKISKIDLVQLDRMIFQAHLLLKSHQIV